MRRILKDTDAYPDTEGTFRPERIIQIAERFGIDGQTAVENILIARAENSENQHDNLQSLSESFATGEFRLLVIDSICALFRRFADALHLRCEDERLY